MEHRYGVKLIKLVMLPRRGVEQTKSDILHLLVAIPDNLGNQNIPDEGIDTLISGQTDLN